METGRLTVAGPTWPKTCQETAQLVGQASVASAVALDSRTPNKITQYKKNVWSWSWGKNRSPTPPLSYLRMPHRSLWCHSHCLAAWLPDSGMFPWPTWWQEMLSSDPRAYFSGVSIRSKELREHGNQNSTFSKTSRDRSASVVAQQKLSLRGHLWIKRSGQRTFPEVPNRSSYRS